MGLRSWFISFTMLSTVPKHLLIQGGCMRDVRYQCAVLRDCMVGVGWKRLWNRVQWMGGREAEGVCRRCQGEVSLRRRDRVVGGVRRQDWRQRVRVGRYYSIGGTATLSRSIDRVQCQKRWWQRHWSRSVDISLQLIFSMDQSQTTSMGQQAQRCQYIYDLQWGKELRRARQVRRTTTMLRGSFSLPMDARMREGVSGCDWNRRVYSCLRVEWRQEGMCSRVSVRIELRCGEMRGGCACDNCQSRAMDSLPQIVIRRYCLHRESRALTYGGWALFRMEGLRLNIVCSNFNTVDTVCRSSWAIQICYRHQCRSNLQGSQRLCRCISMELSRVGGCESQMQDCSSLEKDSSTMKSICIIYTHNNNGIIPSFDNPINALLNAFLIVGTGFLDVDACYKFEQSICLKSLLVDLLGLPGFDVALIEADAECLAPHGLIAFEEGEEVAAGVAEVLVVRAVNDVDHALAQLAQHVPVPTGHPRPRTVVGHHCPLVRLQPHHLEPSCREHLAMIVGVRTQQCRLPTARRTHHQCRHCLHQYLLPYYMQNAVSFIFTHMRNFQLLKITSQPATIIYLLSQFTLMNPFIITMYLLPQLSYDLILTSPTLISILILLYCCFLTTISLLGPSLTLLLKVLVSLLSIIILPLTAICIHTIFHSPLPWNILHCCLLTFALFCHCCTRLFDFSIDPRQRSLLQKRYSPTHLLSAMVPILHTIALECLPITQQVIYASFAVILVSSALRIRSTVTQQVYKASFTELLYEMLLMAELAGTICIVLYQLTKERKYFTNALFMVPAVTALAGMALTQYRKCQLTCNYYLEAKTLKSIGEAKQYLQFLALMATKQCDPTIPPTLHKEHSLHCVDALCYCHATTEEFIHRHIESQLKVLTTFGELLPNILYFRVVMYCYYPLALSYLRKETSSLAQSFSHYIVRAEVQLFIEGVNRKADALDVESVLRLERVKSTLIEDIVGDIHSRTLLWKYLSKGMCEVETLQEYSNKINRCLCSVLRIEAQMYPLFKRNKEFCILLLYYFSRVADLPLTSELRTNIQTLFLQFTSLEFHSLQRLGRSLYEEQVCVLLSKVTKESFGCVENASQGVFTLFGVPPQEIIGRNTNELMPTFIRPQHDRILQEWLDTGQMRTINKLKEIFCVHKNNYCYTAIIYLKLSCQLRNTYPQLFVIGSFFKMNHLDYMLLEPNLTIKAMGCRFQQLLHLLAVDLNLNTLLTTPLHASIAKLNEKTLLKNVFLTNLPANSILITNIKTNSQPQEKRVLESILRNNLMDSLQKYEVEFEIRRVAMRNVDFIVIRLKQYHKCFEKQLCNTVVEKESSSHNDDYKKSYNTNESNYNTCMAKGDIENSSTSQMKEKQGFTIAQTIKAFIGITMDPKCTPRLKYISLSLIFLLVSATISIFFISLLYSKYFDDISAVLSTTTSVSDLLSEIQLCYQQQLLTPPNPLPLNQSKMFFYNSTLNLSLQQYQSQINSTINHLLSSIHSTLQRNTFDNSNYLKNEEDWSYQGTPLRSQTLFILSYHLSALSRFRMLTPLSDVFSLNALHLTAFSASAKAALATQHLCFIIYCILLALLTGISAAILLCTFRSASQLRLSCANVYASLPISALDKLTEYYSMLSVQGALLKQGSIQQDTLFNALPQTSLNSKKRGAKLHIVDDSTDVRWVWVVVGFFLVNGGNYLASKVILDVQTPIIASIDYYQGMMGSKHRQLETYLTLLQDPTTEYPYTQHPTFQKYALLLSHVYHDIDPHFESQFIAALSFNLCDSIVNVVSNASYGRCRRIINGTVLANGGLFATDFIAACIYQAFNSTPLHSFTVIDNVIPYLYSFYTVIQALFATNTNRIFQETLQTFIKFSSVGVLLNIIIIVLLLIYIQRENRSIISYHGYLLNIPFSVLNEQRQISYALNVALSYQKISLYKQ